MEVVTGLLSTKGIQEVGSYVRELLDGGSADFESVLTGLIQPDAENNTNEEELFAALVLERIGKLKGDDAAASYQEALESEKAKLQRPDGITSYETASNNALNLLVTNGTLTQEEADTIHAQAFEAAQLDDNGDLLYDGRGCEGDPTIARMEMERALEMARLKIEAFDSGDATADTGVHGLKAVSTTAKSLVSSGNGMDGAGGFLWKPVSDSNGKLVVLLPGEISDSVQSLVLKDPNGTVIEQGTFTSMANPDAHGDRAHFRFSKPGSQYPANVVVEATLSSGETVTYTVADPSQRCD